MRHSQEFTRELVDWRLAEYLRRGDGRDDPQAGFLANVSHANGRPIIFLRDRKRAVGLPTGQTELLIGDRKMVGNFVKIALNVVHSLDSAENELPSILRGWFGPDAGSPGTSHAVRFSKSEDGGTWIMEPSVRSQVRIMPQLWHPYLRENIPPLFGFEFNPAIWNAGFISLPGHIFLLVNLEKEGLDNQSGYDNRFLSVDQFQWQSQNRTTRSSSHGLAIHNQLNIDVHLFVRRSKRATGGTSAPFIYSGEIDFVSWEGDQPITVKSKLRQPLPQRAVGSLMVPEGPASRP